MNIVTLIESNDLGEGEATAVSLKSGHKLAVYRVEDVFYVTDDRCTHAEASLSTGWLEGHIIACPVHDGEFDIRCGEPRCFPVTVPLKTYKAWVEEGKVMADLDTPAVEANDSPAISNEGNS